MRRLANRAKRHAKEPGAPPGTLVVHPEAEKPAMYLLAYNGADCMETVIDDVAAIREHLGKWPVVWVNVDGLGDIEVIEQLGDLFGLHRLALEDVLSLNQRPKVEEYEGRLFLVARMIEPGMPVRTEQISMFLGEGFVLTFQEHPGDCLDIVRKRLREGRGRIRTMGADYLAYCLLDALVDAYFPHLDELSDLIEAMETEVLEDPTARTVSRIHQLKRDLLTVRRIMASLREAINALIRQDEGPITDATRLYLRDCYDHTVRILDLVETYRELAGGLLDVYLSSVSNRMNEVMKVLTVIATMFIPLTFLAGIYGMNFNGDVSRWNMPELRWYWGYPAFIAAIVVLAVLELFLFWRKGWLGGGGEPEKGERTQGKDD